MLPRIFVLAVIASLLAPWPASPCSCREFTLKESLDRSDAVFVGKVIRLEPLGVWSFRAILKPVEVVKGSLPGEVEFVTGVEVPCSFGFDLAETYLVFANRNDGVLNTSGCSRNGKLKNVIEDLKALGLERLLTNSGTSHTPLPEIPQ